MYDSVFYPESKFGGFSDIDGTLIFYSMVNSLIQSSDIILDIGCGVGISAKDPIHFRRDLQMLRGKCIKIIGIDVDESAKINPLIDEFHIIKNDHFLLPNESIDLAVCDSVLEHVKNPDLFFSECQRVLKPTGYLCIRTSNALGYVGMLSKMVPNRYHYAILRKIKPNKNEKDVFPTYYQCNTVNRIRRILDKSGFYHCVYGHESEPTYLSFSKFFYWLGVMHQKFSPGRFKLTIFAFARKKEIF